MIVKRTDPISKTDHALK